MGEQAMADLAAFITGSLEDYGQFINAEDKTVIGGDVANGETLFTASCVACHGADGTLINFGDEDDPEYLGTVAQGNPWEFAHKVRFGQPGTPMPSAITSGWIPGHSTRGASEGTRIIRVPSLHCTEPSPSAPTRSSAPRRRTTFLSPPSQRESCRRPGCRGMPSLLSPVATGEMPPPRGQRGPAPTQRRATR